MSKHTFILLILPLFLLVSCNRKSFVEYWSNGNIKLTGYKKGDYKVGLWREYHSNGTLKAKGKYKIDKKVPLDTFYFVNPETLEEGFVVNYPSRKKGTWKYYDNEGRELTSSDIEIDSIY